ncbi:uncharacterized protein N7483_005934 [Penicillium malachiteum]|uniref:uncharacterized protein n=1 Tax=Penicillium malachiteum TaxID=1324776 RepID=UPI002546C6CE|nr:uncharacterized protein N7483_005934 [Penicillium malachiteum]KAJ5731426.1 hypothetical protein N7483_005934 [Penicillium malachiteum]
MLIYREAELADLPEIQDIDTYYVLHTSLTLMRSPPPLETNDDKWSDLKNSGLPFLVAVDNTASTSEKVGVVGYTYLSPFRGHLLSYAPTVELSLFVHPDYRSQNIGTSLLHRILELVNYGNVHHRVELNTDQETGVEDAIQVNARSRVRNIIVVIAVDPEGLYSTEWLKTWYIQQGFKE